MNTIPCQFQNHIEQKVITICLHKACQSKRLCCQKCFRDFHITHPQDQVGIDLFNNFIEQESKKQIQFPQASTFGQCQLIKGLEQLLNQIDDLKIIIKEKIETLKNYNLQQYLKQYRDNQQDTNYWNHLIEGMLPFVEIKKCHLTLNNQKYGQLSLMEEQQLQIINKVKDSFKYILKQFDNFSYRKHLKFKTTPIILEGHKDYVMGVAISHDGSIIVSGSKDGTAKLWNIEKKELLQTFKYTSRVQEVALSPNKQYLAYGGGYDFSIQLHDIKQNKNLGKLIGHKYQIAAIIFSQDSKLIFSGGLDCKIIIWNLMLRKKIHKIVTGSNILTIVFSHDYQLISCICDDQIYVWAFSTIRKLIYQKSPHYQGGYGLCSTKDSSTFISSGYDGLIKIWNLRDDGNNRKSFTLSRQFKAIDKGIWKVILTSDEQYIISICNQKTILMVHEIESGNLIQQILSGNGNQFQQQQINQLISLCGQISFSDDMNVLVSSGGDDKIVKIWTRE